MLGYAFLYSIDVRYWPLCEIALSVAFVVFRLLRFYAG